MLFQRIARSSRDNYAFHDARWQFPFTCTRARSPRSIVSFIRAFSRHNFSRASWSGIRYAAGWTVLSRRRYSGQVVSRNCGRRGQQIACFRASLHHSVTLLTLAGNPSCLPRLNSRLAYICIYISTHTYHLNASSRTRHRRAIAREREKKPPETTGKTPPDVVWESRRFISRWRNLRR